MAEGYVGKQVAGQFRIVERIGSGGMGAVYKADQPDMNRFVAIKILHSKYLSRSDLVSRFRREARAMSQLSHPNTARVFLYGQLEDGSCYFVMEYLEGRNLAQLIRAEGPMDPHRAIEVMVPVCGALEEAHQAGIIHRDLKPENVFLSKQGGIDDFPKVLDFGLAKVTEKQMRPGSVILTREGMVFGTPEFMSPEQAQGHSLDGRSDIYSLGVIMYEMLTGKLPFDAKQPMEFIRHHVDTAPIPLSERAPGRGFPPGLEDALMRALAKAPDARYPSAAAFGDALRNVSEGKPDAQAPEQRSATPAGGGADPGVGFGTDRASGGSVTGASAASGLASRSGSQPDEPISSPPMSALPWLVLGAGVALAVGGAIALAVAYLGQ